MCKEVSAPKPHGESAEHFIALVGAPLAHQGGPRVQVDRDAKRVHAGPEIPYRRLVEILGGVHVADVRIAVDENALKAELGDAAIELVASGAHVLERHGGEAQELLRMRFHHERQFVVHPLCGVDRDLAIRYALDARLSQREHHALDAAAVHLLKPKLDVGQSLLDRSEEVGKVVVRLAGAVERVAVGAISLVGRQIEMLLERNFAL